MKKFYFTKSFDFTNLNKPDVKAWGSIYKIINVPIGLIDRNNYIRMPYRYKVYEPFNMPTDITNFNFTYEDCCINRALELVDLSKKLDKPITIFYSGGIDSTTVLTSFMRVLDKHELKNRIRVALTRESISENVHFYHNHIRRNCTMISSENYSNMMDGSSILLGGEQNDQLFGSDILGKIYKFFDSEKLHEKYSREFIVGWFNRFIPEDQANVWFNVLDEQIQKSAPCEVYSNFHFFWWYNFCFKWQFVFFRMLAFTNPSSRHLINSNFIDNYYHHFFSSQDFQKWSMTNHDKKLMSDWRSYKWESKKFIYDYNKDESYRDNKVKIGSLFNLMLRKKVCKGITDEYEFLDEVNLEEFYDPNNSFV